MTFLVTHVGVIVCPVCNRRPGRKMTVVGQGLCRVSGTALVNVRIDFECPHCRDTRQIVRTVPQSQVLGWIAEGIRKRGWAVRYVKPIDVVLTAPITPSRNPMAPAGPITAAELERARRRLARTSFKRRTKSWNGFIQRIRDRRA